jgi:hypothetical protein
MLGSARSLAPALAALALASAAAVVLGASASTSAASTLTNPKHFFWAPGQSLQGTVDATANDLIYHGGNLGSGAIGVETNPAVYLIYWGQEWGSGYTIADTNGTLYSSKTLQNYVNSFFADVGGSPWAGVQTQYCRGVLVGSTSCAGTAGDVITNPKHQLKGVLEPWDAVRIAPGVMRCVEAGSDGAELLLYAAPKTAGQDAELAPGWWAD